MGGPRGLRWRIRIAGLLHDAGCVGDVEWRSKFMLGDI